MNQFTEILFNYWGYKNFRPLQEDIIRSVYEGNDTLALMPTGGGKSITFQVPAMAREGVCIVVTPLIALMKDQVENLKAKKIRGTAVYSGMTHHEIEVALENCLYGNYKFLYLSPERLNTEMFLNRLEKMKVNLLAIDESHCISQWGYDFRPSYLNIASIREIIPKVPVLAVTATATPEVVEDIQNQLKFKKKNVFQKSFERKNLVYVVREIEDKYNYLLKRIINIKGTGIVYVRNRKETKAFSDFLVKNGISADYYHAGLDSGTRDIKQKQWKTGSTRIIVSTNAFGMGIDKPDVRFVAHLDIPETIEAYFQEAGRGGRDEKMAFSVLLFNQSDVLKLRENFEKSFPPPDMIRSVYQALGNYLQLTIGSGKGMSFEFNLYEFSKNYKMDMGTVLSSLKFLERDGYIEVTDEIDNPSRIMILASHDELYNFQLKNKVFDSFIKLLLRSYTGLFQDYVKINESWLSKTSGISDDVIDKYLNKLNEFGVIRYIKQNKNPMIIFTEERLDTKSVVISRENYNKRKAVAEKKLEAVINYISETTKCRSQFLLSYFGQKKSERCGYCDICKKRNELELSKFEFDLILDNIKSILSVQPVSLIDLINQINKKEEKTIKVIQWLLDNKKMFYNDENKLSWNK